MGVSACFGQNFQRVCIEVAEHRGFEAPFSMDTSLRCAVFSSMPLNGTRYLNAYCQTG